MTPIDRRQFLTLGAGAAAVAAVAACSSDSKPSGAGESTNATRSNDSRSPSGLGNPKDAPFDHVVVLMMENRSFDHMLGWLPGAHGKQAGLEFADLTGKKHATWDLRTDYQGCQYMDPQHQWPAGQTQYNNGQGGGFLFTQVNDGEQTPVDLWPISYFGQDAVPVLGGLAQRYTTLDRYFAALNAGTWPNRIYQVAGTTDVNFTGLFLPDGTAAPQSKIETTIWDRIKDAGLTGGYYSYGEPMTKVFASGKYDDISFGVDAFFDAAKHGTLPNLTLVEPDYTSQAEEAGTSSDDHPYGSIQVGEGYIKRVYDAIASSPQWDKTVLVVNFDEWGGFYDHVIPPQVEDDTVGTPPGPNPDYRQLGFRVPCIVISPWSPKRVVSAGPYEHCSILRMIEWRWGLEPLTLRDKQAKNLAEVLDFSLDRAPAKLPAFTAPTPVACATTGNE